MYLGSRDPHTQVVINWNGTKLVADESTWTPAVYCAFREILDNSLDEVLGNHHGDKIDVEFDPKTITFGIRDNGRGIPIDWDEHERMHKATLALSHARAGRPYCPARGVHRGAHARRGPSVLAGRAPNRVEAPGCGFRDRAARRLQGFTPGTARPPAAIALGLPDERFAPRPPPARRRRGRRGGFRSRGSGRASASIEVLDRG